MLIEVLEGAENLPHTVPLKPHKDLSDKERS